MGVLKRDFFSSNAFTLIEVLLVVIILSVSLTVIISSLVTCLRGISYIRDYTQAVWLLDDKLTEIMTSTDLIDEQGEFEPPFQRFRYGLEIRDPSTDQARLLNSLQEVAVEVVWRAGRNEKKIQTVVWIGNPEAQRVTQ